MLKISRPQRTNPTKSSVDIGMDLGMPNDNEINSDFHSMYKSSQHFTMNNYQLYLREFDELGNGLNKIFNELKLSNEGDTLDIYINSAGGSIYEGFQFYNIINNIFKETTITYLDPMGYSMGALLFCMAQKRIAFETSSIMFHDYYSSMQGKSQEQEDYFNHSKPLIHSFFKKLIVTTGFLTPEEFEKMLLGKEYWFDVKEMAERGICTHIVMDGYEYTSEEYLKRFKPVKQPRVSKTPKTPKTPKSKVKEESDNIV